ncbi:MAG: hypothetical protein HOV86_07040 [Thermoactinospora sp.]|nr:hypothetical protein [Thermoactinospora sp.]
MIAILTSAALVLTPAAADPLAPLKQSPLYKVGKLSAPCAKKLPKKGTSRASTEKYVTALVACLNDAWQPKIEKNSFPDADLVWDEVSVKFTDDALVGEGKSKDSMAVYYFRQLSVQLENDWIKAKTDHALLREVTLAYSRHPVVLSGLAEHYDRLPDYEIPRFVMTTGCLGATFLKSVWTTQKRTAKEWKTLVAGVATDELGKTGWLGKKKNREYWLNAGFKTGDPRSCNTWRAPDSRVK